MKTLVTAGPLKVAVARVLGSSFCGRAIGSLLNHQIPNHGLVFKTDDPVVASEVEAQLFFRLYEGAEVRLARRYIRPEAKLVVDLGSSLGIVAAHLLDRMSATGRLICVEANPSLLPYLRSNTAAHSRGQSVAIVHAAISYDRGSTFLRLGDASVSSRTSNDLSPGAIEVPSTTLASLLGQFALRERFALVCDIEGAEAGIILEDQAILSRCGLMIAELHATTFRGNTVSVRDMYLAMRRQGFEVLDQRGPVFVFARLQDSQRPFK